MSDDRSLIKKSLMAALPYAALSESSEQPSPSHAGKARTDLCGTVALENGLSFDACFEAGRFSSFASLESKARSLRTMASELRCAPVIVAPYFTEAKQRYLQDIGMNYLDSAGNARIVLPGIFIDRSGKKPSTRSIEGPRSLFSDKATLILRLLFSGEVLGIREMSGMLKDAGFSLSPGYISKTVSALVESRYAVREKSGVRLVSRSLLLEDWVEFYTVKARRETSEGWFLPELDSVALAETVGSAVAGRGALTDRSGAQFVDPYASFDAVDVLPRDYAAVVESLRAAGAEPVSRGANINVRGPVYPVSSFFDARDIRGIPVVSDIQLYLDLRCQPQRGREAADHLYQRFLRPLLEGRGARDE